VNPFGFARFLKGGGAKELPVFAHRSKIGIPGGRATIEMPEI